MASPKPLQSFHVFTFKSPSSSSKTTLSSMKFKNLVQAFILSHFCRIVRALTKAKTIFIEVVKDIQFINLVEFTTKKQKNKNKPFFGSFRMHYNWCSSHVLPVPSPEQANNFPISHSYYDATWDSIISPECDDMEESQLSGYLNWLEKKVCEDSKKSGDMNEIDKLADKFIANCHEKFMIEKQESYRMFQEMMARSV